MSVKGPLEAINGFLNGQVHVYSLPTGQCFLWRAKEQKRQLLLSPIFSFPVSIHLPYPYSISFSPVPLLLYPISRSALLKHFPLSLLLHHSFTAPLFSRHTLISWSERCFLSEKTGGSDGSLSGCFTWSCSTGREQGGVENGCSRGLGGLTVGVLGKVVLRS